MHTQLPPHRILHPENGFELGKCSYKEARENKRCLVDKSLLIKEFILDEDGVVILSRPRRFGKSMNMSMLQRFFEIPGPDMNCGDAFEGNLISEEKDIMEQHYHKYPLIFLDFKEIRRDNWEDTYISLCRRIANEIGRNNKARLL